MSWLEGFQRGRKAAYAARGAATPAPLYALSGDADVSPPGEPSPIKLGYYRDPESGESGEPNLFYGERHICLFGVNGAGKSTRFLVELLATVSGRSLLVFDMKGELAAQTAAARRRFGRVAIINPFQLHTGIYPDLASDGFNPLALLDPASDNFYSDASALAHALIEIGAHETQRHWPEGAQGLMIALIMWEAVLAKRERRPASLVNVITMLTEAEELGPPRPDGKRRLVKGLQVTAARMIAEGGPQIAMLVGDYVRAHGLGEIASLSNAAKVPTRWVADRMIRADLEKDGVDFARLRQEPTTIYVILPSTEMTEFRPWSRVVISAALRAQFRAGPVGTLFVLDEFFAALGHLKIIEDVWALVRGYGIQLMPILQSALQLKALYNDNWETIVGQSGLVATLGPPGDLRRISDAGECRRRVRRKHPILTDRAFEAVECIPVCFRGRKLPNRGRSP
jgi:type IV secretion system protein VirD4